MAARPLVRTVATALAAATLLAACGSHGGAAPSAGVTGAQGRVIALTKMSELQTLFNRDQGHARLVLIFSPT